MAKMHFILFTLFTLIFAGCQRSSDGDDFVNNNPPSTVATYTVPTGSAAVSSTGIPYTFSLTISGINGFGEISGEFTNITGSADVNGLSIFFTPLTEVGFFTFQTTGTVSGSFSGNGTITITVTYIEEGVLIFDNVVSFDVTHRPLSYRSEDTPIGGFGSIASGIEVPFGLPAITDVRVRVNATSLFSETVALFLASPSGEQLALRGITGGEPTGGSSNIGVVFDDAAVLDITTDFAGNTPLPFIAFRPEEALSTFDGDDPTGTWSLVMTDYYFYAFGTSLIEWAIAFNGDTSIIEPNITTPTAGSFSSGVLSLPIDDTLEPTVSTITIPAGVPIINDLRIRVNISHTAVGNLEVSLTSPGVAGATRLLINNRGAAGDDMQVIFDDEATLDIEVDFAGSSGSPFDGYRPENPLTIFDDTNPAGTWTLTIVDTLGGDVGTLNGWDLAINGDESIFVDF